MACTGIQPSLRRLVLDASRTREIPSFLLPSISFRSFSSSHAQRSRIGREAITIPPEVTLRFFDLPKGISRSRNPDTATSALEVTGPLGEYDTHISLTWCGRLTYNNLAGQLTVPLPPYLATSREDEGKKLIVNVGDPDETHQRAMWGTSAALPELESFCSIHGT